MHELYELKEMLCEELKEYGKKGEMSAGTLDVVDKLAHTVKNLDKIIEMYEESEYSERDGMMYRGGSYRDGSYRGGSYRNSYDGGSYEDGESYARGRGRNARRDSRGRYASANRYYRADADFDSKLRELINEAPDEHKRMELERLADRSR